jgi:hypothetical protein
MKESDQYPMFFLESKESAPARESLTPSFYREGTIMYKTIVTFLITGTLASTR